MRHSRLLTPLAGTLALLVGCAPARFHKAPSNSFLAPEVATAPRIPVVPDPPAVPASDWRVHLGAAPGLPAAVRAQAPSGWLAVLLRDADWRLQAGRKAYQEGDIERARREFNRALDILLAPPEDAESPERAAIHKKIEQLVEEIYRYDLELSGAGEQSEERAFERSPLDDIPPPTFPVDPALKNRVLEEIRSTLSQLPLEATDEVLAYIQYFSRGRGRRILEQGLRRAGRYRPLIQRILDEEGVPQELIYVAQAESGFQPRAVSRKRATGMWQFMRARGQQYGLQQTRYTDDRMDPEKATRAAARHLRDLYHQFGDWYLALAAYNAGPVAVERAVERTGYADFWELRRRNVLPRETASYVPIILAMTIIAKNAAEYGFHTVLPDPPLEYDSIELTAATDLKLVADLLERPLAELRELNPSLLKDLAPAGHLLHIPKGQGVELAPVLAEIPPERRTGWRAHRVAEGETLGAIARRYGMPERSIAGVNGDLTDGVQAGDWLLIPQPQRSIQPSRRAGTGARSSNSVGARQVRTVRRSTTARDRTAAPQTARLSIAGPSGRTTRR